VFLRIKNTGFQDLNIAVLDIEPTWAISQFPINGIEDIFFTLADDQEIYLKMRPALPAGDDDKPAKETLKLFATRGMANFEWLTLPALDVDWGQRGGNFEEMLDQKVKEFGEKGASTNISPLNNLLSIIGADVKNSPKSTRAMLYDPDPNAEWLTKQVTFTITK